MNPERLKALAVATASIAVSAAVGVSLTRSPTLSSGNPFAFGAAGGLIGMVAVLIFLASRERISQALPPPRQLRGLKVFIVGFLIALIGWLVAAFASRDAGIKVAAAGFIVGALGMGMHFYLRFNSDA